ncbi:hypothetical protein SARC_06923 [Sphaeroforma arctica JP610]|uniref:Uncharacterized protein n=1 Tax=Sphaeroforma arctica JP610 TaxID=667725 RepID=A0A0L0FVY5_9EUKA|nr:hypothetical protein SARC_06923 [Sphaeroforma arctica JP610]KNC80721.1 hypothetical protein SARC_06923 [Sphaeroforma arctica JP610]|eukprot:XP_014154623.1 hypothetical protein SARC_06923 [Sphaeroforma arctica JP610]
MSYTRRVYPSWSRVWYIWPTRHAQQFCPERRIQSVYDKVAFQKKALQEFKLTCGDPVSVSDMQIRGIVAGRLNLDYVDGNNLTQLGVHDGTDDSDHETVGNGGGGSGGNEGDRFVFLRFNVAKFKAINRSITSTIMAKHLDRMVQELTILRSRDPDTTITEFDRLRTVHITTGPKNNTRSTISLFENVDHEKDVLDVRYYANWLIKATANIWDLFGINRSVMLYLARLVIVLDLMTESIMSLIPRPPPMEGLDVTEVWTDMSQFDSMMNRYKRGKPIPNTPSAKMLLDTCRDSYRTLTDSKTYPNLVGTWKRYVDMRPMYCLCHGWMKDIADLRRSTWRNELISKNFWTKGRIKRPDTTPIVISVVA